MQQQHADPCCGINISDVSPAENALRSLLEALTSPPYAPMQHLEREQALAKQFAEILHFTLSFDELKVRRSADYRGRSEDRSLSIKS